MNTPKTYHRFARLATLLLVALLALGGLSEAAAQNVLRVTGRVISKEKRTPLLGVNVIDNRSDRLLATTDEDGRFAVNIHSDATLRFTMIGAEVVRVKVKGRTKLDVELDEHDVELGEATVVAKRIKDKVSPEPTTIEIVGNYFHVKTRVRVPNEIFDGDTRLVVQPVLNNVTRHKLILMRPMVYDAREYNRTQRRMYDFDLEGGDPLARYITVRTDSLHEKGRHGDIIGYSDSIYVENVKDEFTCDIYMAIEDYNKILYRDTTVIARGTVNPLRFLDYSFGGGFVLDSAYYPTPELQLRDSRGSVNLTFPVGKAHLDTQNPQNAEELAKLRARLQSIASSKDSELRAFSIVGTASPDGRYAANLQLAQRRMNTALEHITSQLDAETRQHMEVSSKARVAEWKEVSAMLRKDSLFAEADAIDHVLANWRDRDAQSSRIARLPFYRTVLEATYLPRLRRVDYEMNYSVFRHLTIDEIRELYAKDYQQLSRYEFFALYRAETDTAAQSHILRQALEVYPHFQVAASDYQSLLIARGESDPELLRPFAGKKAPAQLNANHAIASIENGRYAAADSVVDYIPVNDDTRLLLAVVGALNGQFSANYETIAATSTRNDVVMLLAMKRNEEALRRCDELPDDEAMTHYFRATCLNRLEKPVEAYVALKKAFRMDPELEKIARVDGDVNDLILDK